MLPLIHILRHVLELVSQLVLSYLERPSWFVASLYCGSCLEEGLLVDVAQNLLWLEIDRVSEI